MSLQARRTYDTRSTSAVAPVSSPPLSDLNSSPPSTPAARKRLLEEDPALPNAPPRTKPRFLFPPKTVTFSQSMMSASTSSKTKAKGKGKGKVQQNKLTQLHFTLETTVLRTCPICDLTYTKGAPDDELLHKTHCARVQRGLEWGKEEERESPKAGVEEIHEGIKLKNGAKGRVVCFRADVGGKIGAKLSQLLEMINLTLSSPPLSADILQASKAYLFLLPSSASSFHIHREKIIGCVIAQRITTAMSIASTGEISAASKLPKPISSTSLLASQDEPENQPPPSSTSDETPPTLIPVDTVTNLYVHPQPLPTPMGVPRLFVSSSHRRLGIASCLLTAAAESFILGCPLDPTKGEVAFTQPTGAGKGVLEKWGKGGVRIYEE